MNTKTFCARCGEAVENMARPGDVANLILERDELRQFLADAQGFINTATTQHMTPSLIIATLAHDINGLLKRDVCFLPRVSHYGATIGANA